MAVHTVRDIYGNNQTRYIGIDTKGQWHGLHNDLNELIMMNKKTYELFDWLKKSG